MTDSQITVGVDADIGGIEDGMQRAAQAVRDGFAAIQQSAAAAGVTLGQVGATATKTGQTGKAANLEWAGSFKPVVTAFNSSVSGMILGTTTWQKAVQRIGQTFLQSQTTLGLQELENWIAKETGMTTATETGAAARTAAEQSAGDASLASLAIKALKVIISDAAQTFGGVFAFLSPIMGPAAAAPAAAASASVMSMAGDVSIGASAAGGLWNVPADMLALVHAQETILPAGIAAPMRNFFAGGGAGGSGGDTYSISIQAIDTQSGAQFLMNNAGTIAKGLMREKRNGNAVFRARV